MAVKSSLREEVIPFALKGAIVHHHLKKPLPIPAVLDNLHLRLQLPFLRKATEKVAQLQLPMTSKKADDLDPFKPVSG